MNSIQISKTKKFALLIATLSLVLGGLSTANAATKTITCYKGTIVKKVTATSPKVPKCPTGYTTKKPVVKPTAAATVKPTTAATTPAVASNKLAHTGSLIRAQHGLCSFTAVGGQEAEGVYDV